MDEERGDWPALVERSAAISALAVELSALSQDELPGLTAFLRADPCIPFHYVSVHAPSKGLDAEEAERVHALTALPADRVVTPLRVSLLGGRRASGLRRIPLAAEYGNISRTTDLA